MNYKVLVLAEFKKNAKVLAKKYKNLKQDLRAVTKLLATKPTSGTHLFNNCYKIRLANSSIPTGKSGGFRVITYCLTQEQEVYLLTIYSKKDQETITDNEIIELIKTLNI